jgi:hypothetical protein
MPRVTFSAFPEEILAEIIGYSNFTSEDLGSYSFFIQWKSTLPTRANLTRVSRKFWRLATPLLYSSFCIPTYTITQAEAFLSTIKNNAYLGTLVRCLVIQGIRGRTRLYRRITDNCPNLIYLQSSDVLDITNLPRNLRNVIVAIQPLSAELFIQSLLPLQSLESLTLHYGIATFTKTKTNDITTSSFTHLPLLREVGLQGYFPIEIIRAIFHSDSPIRTVDISGLSLPEEDVLPAFSLMRNVTDLSLPDTEELDFLRNTLSDKRRHLFPQLKDLTLKDEACENPPSTLGFDVIRSLTVCFGGYDIDLMLQWAEYLENRVGSQNDPLQLEVFCTQEYLDDMGDDDVVHMRSAVENLAKVGVEWIAITNSGRMPMKECLSNFEARKEDDWSSYSSD